MGLFRQMIGRGLRPADGKKDCIILDHSGAVFAHGLPEDHVEWTLRPDRKAQSPAHVTRLKRKSGGLLECSQCSALRLAGEPCPHCGFLPQRPARPIPIRDGELGLVTNGRAHSTPADPETRQRWHSMLTHIARERGYKPGWIAHKYKEKFGAFPNWHANPDPIPPSPEVRSWVRSRQIAYAKRPVP
jgi:superfamily II DNA or RNA helicase